MEEKIATERLQAWRDFVRKNRVERVLAPLVSALLAGDGTKVQLQVTNDLQPRTDGEQICISMLPGLLPEQYEKVWPAALRAITAHECQHVNSSRFQDVGKIRDWYGKRLAEHGFPQQVGETIGSQVLNICEDGRIEQISVSRHPGLLKPYRILNDSIREGTAIQAKAEKPEGEFSDFLSCLLSYAKTGLYAPGAEAYAGTPLESAFLKAVPHIDAAVAGRTSQDCFQAVQALLTDAQSYIESLLNASPQMRDEMNRQEPQEEYRTSEEKEYNDSASSDAARQLRQSVRKEEQDRDADSPQEESAGPDSDSPQKDSQEETGGKGDGQNPDPGQDEESGSSIGRRPRKNDREKDQAQSSPSQEPGTEETGDSPEESEDSPEGDQDESSNAGDAPVGNQPGRQKKSGRSAARKSQTSDGTGGQDSQATDSASGEEPSEDRSSNGTTPGFRNPPKREDPGYTEEDIRQFSQNFAEEAARASQKEKKTQPVRESLDPRVLRKLFQQAYGDDGSLFEESWETFPVVPLPPDVRADGARLRREIQEIIRQRTAVRRNLKNGILSQKDLWRTGLGDQDLFWKPGEGKTSMVFTLLIDNSGSMYASSGMEDVTKSFAARRAAAVLEEATRGIVPVKIALYHTLYSAQHRVLRGFDDPRMQNCCFSSLQAISPSGGNTDSVHIRVCAAELARRPERRKVLIVLSDGLPSGYRGVDQGVREVSLAVRDARAMGILVLPIMFGNEEVRAENRKQYVSMYGNQILSVEPARIARALPTLMRNLIRQG